MPRMTAKFYQQPKASQNVRWLSLAEALARLASPANEEEAWARLARRLGTGSVRTRAAVMEERLHDYAAETSVDVSVPRSLWTHATTRSLVDAPTGTLEIGTALPEDNRPLTITLHGVQIVEADLADALGPPAAGRTARSAGRPLGSFWPFFAEELAVYVHDNGVPDSNTPLARVILEILDRMALGGQEQPSPPRCVR